MLLASQLEKNLLKYTFFCKTKKPAQKIIFAKSSFDEFFYNCKKNLRKEPL